MTALLRTAMHSVCCTLLYLLWCEVVEDDDGRSASVEQAVQVDDEATARCETVLDGGSGGATDPDEDADQLALMTCSLSSTTSGFDDSSCASSTVGVDEMPSEETWNFDVSEEEPDRQHAAVTPCGDPRQITAEQVSVRDYVFLGLVPIKIFNRLIAKN